MDITVNAGTLRTAAAWVASVAPAKPTSPIFSGVHLTATHDVLRLSATDYDLFVDTTIPTVKGREPGCAVVSARLLAAITMSVRAADDLTLRTTGRGVSVTCGGARWALPTLDLREWPAFPDLGGAVGDVDVEAFMVAVTRTTPVASISAAESFLGGVQLTFGPQLAFVATDRYRLAVAEVPWRPYVPEVPRPVMVPTGVLRVVTDALKGTRGAVTVRVNDAITFTTDHHQVTGRLIDTQFVQWEPSLPDPVNAIATVVVSTGELGDALTQVSVSDLGSVVHVVLAVSPVGITMRLKNDPDAADITVPVHSVTGELVTVACSQRYLRDALTTVGSPMAVLRFFGGPAAPFLVTAADGDGEPITDGYRHLVVSVRPSRTVGETP